MFIKLVDSIGKVSIDYCFNLGNAGLFLYETLHILFTSKLKIKKYIYQLQHIGVNSISVVALTGACVGGVLAYHTFNALQRFNGERFISPIVFISMAREFGPVLSAIMVAGRAGSAMTAEIGTMKISEQVDALKTLCINPKQYLVVPRILAATTIMPFLSLFCTIFGVMAGYIVAVYMLGVNPELYIKQIKEFAEMFDITSGLIKATCFGFLLSWIATYKGYITRGGAKGVGISTTQSVVYACLAIFIADYVLTALLFS